MIKYISSQNTDCGHILEKIYVILIFVIELCTISRTLQLSVIYIPFIANLQIADKVRTEALVYVESTTSVAQLCQSYFYKINKLRIF